MSKCRHNKSSILGCPICSKERIDNSFAEEGEKATHCNKCGEAYPPSSRGRQCTRPYCRGKIV